LRGLFEIASFCHLALSPGARDPNRYSLMTAACGLMSYPTNGLSNA
jgi:hypothetical protein